MKKDNILFDLDGTIIDSSEGIYASINYAMRKLNKEELPSNVLKTFVGPPLLESFIRIGLTQEKAELAVGYYRELYKKEGMYQVAVYEGMQETLQKLSQDKNIFIATSKPEYFAKKILDYLKFSDYFTGIYGADLAGLRSEKAAVIQYALAMEKLENLSSIVMIGDRKHDILGAKENNLESIGVLYGFGDEKELMAAGANQLISRPIELLTRIN
ncbi:HAD-IA family hydrolase [Enterococcus saccharolyticus]|uniref:HAD-IA family hydrolase n=1 Tax=Enterococcus saccharolyticus TaxID=41997 RepID=UPI001E632091|nr:HAD-IA family hydrolase [Enterococcus saccharolyticus]MCD5003316.1 HAD-IA family hydrolase [Enterococcus saccharolyticus]